MNRSQLPVRFYVLCNLLCQVVSDVEPCLVTLKKPPDKPGTAWGAPNPCREPKKPARGNVCGHKGENPNTPTAGKQPEGYGFFLFLLNRVR